MPESEGTSRLWNRILLVTGALVVAGGLALTFAGPGSELRVPHEATFDVLVPDLLPEVAEQVRQGDPLFTDPAGGRIASVASVQVEPDLRAVPDAEGRLHAAADPREVQLRVRIAATARVGNEVVSLGGQVLQVGQSFNLVSGGYKLTGTVVRIDVR